MQHQMGSVITQCILNISFQANLTFSEFDDKKWEISIGGEIDYKMEISDFTH